MYNVAGGVTFFEVARTVRVHVFDISTKPDPIFGV